MKPQTLFINPLPDGRQELVYNPSGKRPYTLGIYATVEQAQEVYSTVKMAIWLGFSIDTVIE